MLESLWNLLPYILGALALFIIITYFARRWQVASPSQAIIVTKRGAKVTIQDTPTPAAAGGPAASASLVSFAGRIIPPNSGGFVLPFQNFTVMDLGARQITVPSTAQTNSGTPLVVQAVAQCKIDSSSTEALLAAAERFSGKQSEIDNFVSETLQGALRTIIGEMEPESLITDRKDFTERVRDIVDEQLKSQGLHLDNFNIQTIEDPEGSSYLADYARPIAAEKRRVAEIADLNAKREADVARIAAQSDVQEKQRALDLRAAEIRVETDAAGAKAAAAAPLEHARQQQVILEQESVAEARRVELSTRKLEGEVRATADAEAYRNQTIAEGDAQAARVRAEADRDARIASAEADRAQGEAEADVIRAKGVASAEATDAQAKALREQAESLLQQQLIQILPEVARAIAEPYSNIDTLTVVSTDGASQLSQNVARTVSEVPELVKSLTGVDLTAFLAGIAGGKAAGTISAQPPLVSTEV